MEYTAVIRTLGTAGAKYQRLLDSLAGQTLQPKAILVYIAEGYPLPKETIGRERYIYVKKGMVAQRALPYREVTTEYMLFLDDDLYLPPKAVETLYAQLAAKGADVISPDVFPNAERPWRNKLLMAVSGRMMPRRDDGRWGYKVMRNAGYSYNANPKREAYWSQTNAGACFLCRKADFLATHFEEELWLEASSYPLGEDEVMYYKMYLSGLRLLTSFSADVLHLDAGNNYSTEKVRKLIYSDFRFKTIFWHRFIFLPDRGVLSKFRDCCCIGYALGFALLVSLLKGEWGIFRLKWQAMRDAARFLRSEEYRRIPPIRVNDRCTSCN